MDRLGVLGCVTDGHDLRQGWGRVKYPLLCEVRAGGNGGDAVVSLSVDGIGGMVCCCFIGRLAVEPELIIAFWLTGNA